MSGRLRFRWRAACMAATLLAIASRVQSEPAPAAPTPAAPTPGASVPESVGSRFVDSSDGWLDISAFLDTAYGFVPIVSPITEPAVGYGAAAALVFVDRNPPSSDGRFVRPDLTAVGGAATENGTQGVFGAHLGSWMDGHLQTLVGLADADLDLEYFGLGGGRFDRPNGLKYSIGATGGVVGASYRPGVTHAWIGLRYGYARTDVTPGWTRRPPPVFPGRPVLPRPDLSLDLGLLVPTLTFDTRDNFFTPTRGWYVDLSAPFARGAFGSDRDFEKLDLNVIHYRPLGERWFIGVRAAAKTSSDGTPFFLRPFVVLRGVEALRYQGDQAAEVELESRWQVHPRFSLLAFGGTGAARSDQNRADREQTAWGAGVGFRYLAARTYGLHMGVDVAWGPDEPIFYVVFGSAWLRP